MIKILLLIAISAVILTTHGNLDLPICNFTTAKQAIAPRIFAEQTIDGNKQPILQTRFLHNKFGILGSEFTRCYFFSFDPNFIYYSTGIGIVFWVYFFYVSATKKLYIPLSFFLIIPALPFFGFPIVIVSYAHKIFAIIGLAFFL
ncbi:MAG: hypothetical protein Q8P25_04870, partial [Candidatus Curtissbacteria bacterium]|nr:hypothetical protein [Candidatus Curtissbacteria bacterium]